MCNVKFWHSIFSFNEFQTGPQAALPLLSNLSILFHNVIVPLNMPYGIEFYRFGHVLWPKDFGVETSMVSMLNLSQGSQLYKNL